MRPRGDSTWSTPTGWLDTVGCSWKGGDDELDASRVARVGPAGLLGRFAGLLGPAPGGLLPLRRGSGAALDEQLMSLLAAARGYHHQADLHLSQKEPQQAIAALRALLALPLAAKWAEAEEVRLDAAARLAKLLLAQGALDEALELADAQLVPPARQSFYLANLHAVRGEVLEARSKRLDASGEQTQARDVARRAIEAFERSIAINKRLQRALDTKREANPSADREGTR
jgi:tetratricopeptide (TPR) repeat protein